MPSRTARLSKKGCGFATPECRAQRDVAVHPRPAPPPPLLAAPRLSTTARGYLEIRWVVRTKPSGPLTRADARWSSNGAASRHHLTLGPGHPPASLLGSGTEGVFLAREPLPPFPDGWSGAKRRGTQSGTQRICCEAPLEPTSAIAPAGRIIESSAADPG